MATSNRSKGFTLIEVLIALVISSICLLGLASLMVTSTHGNSFGGHMTEAATLAQDKLEELRAIRRNIPEGSSTDHPEGPTGISYTRNWNVVTDGNLRTITVTVNWKDRMDHTISFVSVLSR